MGSDKGSGRQWDFSKLLWGVLKDAESSKKCPLSTNSPVPFLSYNLKYLNI
jgi:hypothetical protein